MNESEILLRLPQVCARTGLARSTIYDLMAANAFPKGVKLGAKSVAWVQAEVSDWVVSRIAASRKAA
ncbi:MAG: AlpA family transcriptional regulator [Gammaproteobacteria bacterium]|nr:AlpA family transcriptional regulator [Gammaproteobacteria bacterium]